MSSPAVTIPAHGVLDHSRAEALAARLRAAVRNGKSEITLRFEAGTVMASPNLLAFLLRTAEALRGRGGRLSLTGDQALLEQFRALGMPLGDAAPSASSQGVGS